MYSLHTLFLVVYFFMAHIHHIYGYDGKNDFTIRPDFNIEHCMYVPTQSQQKPLHTQPIFQLQARQHQLNTGQKNQIDRVNNLCNRSQPSHQKKIGIIATWLQARKIKKDQKKLTELITKSKKAIIKTQQKSLPPVQQQKIILKHETVSFMQMHNMQQQLFTQQLKSPVQQKITDELVAVLDQLATISLYRQGAIHQENLINFCTNVSSLSQQANIAQDLSQAISGKNCCRGIMHYLDAMTGQISMRYEQLQKAMHAFQPVLQEYSVLIGQHALQGAATTKGLELIITAGMLVAPTATAIATTCLIGATACIMAPVCAQAAIDTLSCGKSCIVADWDKVAQDLDNFTTFLRSPETVARVAEFAGGAAIPMPNLNNLVGQILSLRPVITQVQQSCGKTTQSIYLMTKNQIQQAWQQSVELLQRPEFVDFNCAYKKIMGCNFFKLLPKSDPILIAAFDGIESNLITSGENQLITQLYNQSENSVATNVVKSGMTHLGTTNLQNILEQEILQALNISTNTQSADLLAPITSTKAAELANLSQNIRQLQDLAKYTNNFTNLDQLIPEDILYLNRVYELQSYRAQIKNFLDVHKPYFMYEEEKYFIEDIASYHIHAAEYFIKKAPSGGHSNYGGNKLDYFKPQLIKNGPLGSKDVILYNSRNYNLTKPSSIYPQAWSELVCDLKAIEVMTNGNAIIKMNQDLQSFNITGYTCDGLEIRISYDISTKRIKTHHPLI